MEGPSRPAMTTATDQLDRLAIDTIRTLSIDAVQQANSGHPGAPMGAAPMAYTLWTRFLRHAPTRPDWPDRDRFVLSAGHASMLIYSLLHLTGYELPLAELERFRQWGSRTPGHPEYGLTPGIEATTGPLGQGVANAVGMAIAERRLAAEFDRPGHAIVDHRTFVICSDGDLQEGIASEVASPGRPPPSRQADDALRRQPRPARRTDRDGVQRGRPGPVRRIWLAYRPGRRRERHRGDLGRDRDRARRSTTQPDRGPDPHRLRLPEQARQPEGPRLAARSRGGPPDQGGLRLGSRPDLLRPGRGRRAVLPGDPPRRAARRRLGGPAGPLSRRVPGRGRRAHAPDRRRPPPGRDERAQDVRAGGGLRDPQGEPGRRSRPWPRRYRSCSAERPTCPSRT